MAVYDMLQVGSDLVKVGVVGRLCDLHRDLDLHRLQSHQGLALGEVVAQRNPNLQHATGRVGQQHMLHLHGFQHGDLATGRHDVANGHVELHQFGRHRRTHRAESVVVLLRLNAK